MAAFWRERRGSGARRNSLRGKRFASSQPTECRDLLDPLVFGHRRLRRIHQLPAGGRAALLRGRLIGLFNMSNNGLRAFSGVTVGVVGGLIGIHWSLAISAMILLAVTVALFALFIFGRGSEELG